MNKMLNRLVQSIKSQSNATLRSWCYQCESILAQRSRRIQQLFTFYYRVYGPNEFKHILRLYHKQFEPPLRVIMFSAVGLVGLKITDARHTYSWKRERLSLKNFDVCYRDIEFIDTLNKNKLCDKCREKNMKYCYCLLGNKKCTLSGNKSSKPSIRNCRRSLHQIGEEGRTMVEAADESIWEPYLSKDDISIWKREERSAMYAYKVYARFDDITAEDLLYVQTDNIYRKQWDESAIKLETIETDPNPSSNSHLIYWEMQWPKFFSNRDYVYCRRFVIDDKLNVMMICSRGTTHPKYPPYKDKVRVTNYWSFMVIKPFRTFQEPGVHYILTYYDDPGIPIPQSIKSWVTQKQMPDFLKKMYNAAKQYSSKSAKEMQKLHNLNNFSINDNDYSNARRQEWLRHAWRQRETGEN